ncbi:MAG: rhomboid family intramembrane serine protease [Prevotella sp.]|nr:rhomboid family intramembrane serine protease [Prevotella sp.]
MRNIPVITKNLLIINLLAFVAKYVLERQGINLNDVFGLHFFLASNFQFYQLFTYMFMHAGFEHIFFNMFALWMFGCVVERVWGAKRFLFYYLACGVGAGLLQEVSQLGSLYFMLSNSGINIGLGDLFSLSPADAHALNDWTTVGASGAVYAILLAFGMLFPEERIFIFPLPIPIKAKWFVAFYVVVELFSALGTSNSQVAHFAHLGGMLFGFLMIRYWQKHPYGNDGFGHQRGRQFFDNMRKNWEQRKGKSSDGEYVSYEEQPPKPENDMDYNARKHREEDEIDRILDKIRKSGYDSLSEEEKKKLFDRSNRR